MTYPISTAQQRSCGIDYQRSVCLFFTVCKCVRWCAFLCVSLLSCDLLSMRFSHVVADSCRPPSRCCVVFHWISVSQFVDPFIFNGHLDLFPIWACYEHSCTCFGASMQHFCQVFGSILVWVQFSLSLALQWYLCGSTRISPIPNGVEHLSTGLLIFRYLFYKILVQSIAHLYYVVYFFLLTYKI